jgi:hypothetical protein
VVGYIDAVKTGPETSRVRVRFLHVPDAPLKKVTMSFFGGKKGLIENSVDICRTHHRAEFRFKGQNGRSRVSQPHIAVNAASASSAGRVKYSAVLDLTPRKA